MDRTSPAPLLEWARSGLMWLTGRPGGPPLAPAGPVLERAGAALDATGLPPGGDSLGTLLAGRAALLGLGRAGATSANGSCRLLPSSDGWLAVNLARDGDVDLVGALLEQDLPDCTRAAAWAALESAAPLHRCADLLERAQLLGLPAAVLPIAPDPDAESAADPVVRHKLGGPRAGRDPGQPPLVVDLSALWAGPLCAHLLGRAGMRVVKVESTRRPDGARAGNRAFFDWLHAGHDSVALDLTAGDGRAALARLIDAADIVIEASRPRALAQLGIDAEALVASRPGLTWVSITGHGRSAGAVAFGDDAAVAGGLVAWDDVGPVFCGDAIADPLTGLFAASAARACVEGGGGYLVEVAMARVAAHCMSGHCMSGAGVAGAGIAGPGPGRWYVEVDGVREEVARPVPPRPAGRAADLGADTRTVLADLEPRT